MDWRANISAAKRTSLIEKLVGGLHAVPDNTQTPDALRHQVRSWEAKTLKKVLTEDEYFKAVTKKMLKIEAASGANTNPAVPQQTMQPMAHPMQQPMQQAMPQHSMPQQAMPQSMPMQQMQGQPRPMGNVPTSHPATTMGHQPGMQLRATNPVASQLHNPTGPATHSHLLQQPHMQQQNLLRPPPQQPPQQRLNAPMLHGTRVGPQFTGQRPGVVQGTVQGGMPMGSHNAQGRMTNGMQGGMPVQGGMSMPQGAATAQHSHLIQHQAPRPLSLNTQAGIPQNNMQRPMAPVKTEAPPLHGAAMRGAQRPMPMPGNTYAVAPGQAQPVPTKEKEDEYWAKHAELLSHGLLTTLRVYAEKVTEEKGKPKMRKMIAILEETREKNAANHSKIENLRQIEQLFAKYIPKRRTIVAPREVADPFGTLVQGISKLEAAPTATALRVLGKHVRLVWERVYTPHAVQPSQPVGAKAENDVAGTMVQARPSAASKRKWAATLDPSRATGDGTPLCAATVRASLLAHQDGAFWPAKVQGDTVVLEEVGSANPRQVHFVSPCTPGGGEQLPRIMVDAWRRPSGSAHQDRATLFWPPGAAVSDTLAKVGHMLRMLRSAEMDAAAAERGGGLSVQCRLLSLHALVLVCTMGVEGALPKLVVQLVVPPDGSQRAPQVTYRLEYLDFALQSGKRLELSLAGQVATRKTLRLLNLLECWRECVGEMFPVHDQKTSKFMTDLVGS